MDTSRWALPSSSRRAAVLLLAVGLAPTALAAQQVPGPPRDSAATTAQDSLAGVPVVVGGDTLFRVYGRLGPFGPEERAAAIENRMRLLVTTPRFVQDSAAMVEQEGVVELRAGESVLMSVTPADARAMGLTPQEAGTLYLARFQAALAQGRMTFSVRQTLKGLALTLVASLALALVLWAMGWFFPRFYRWLGLRARRLPAVRIQRLELLSSGRIAQTLVWMARAVRVILTAVALIVYVPLVFSFFPVTQPLSDQLLAMILGPVRLAATAIVAYVPNLLSILVIVAFTYYGLRLVRVVFLGLESGTISLPGFYRDWARPTYQIARVLAVAFALVMVWPYLPRSDSAAFRGVAAFLGLLLTFGASSAVANLVGGVVMIYMRPFHVGDRVQISDTVGDVVAKGLLVTRVRTIKQVEITIPNAMVLGSHIINFSAAAADGGVILHTSVSLGYDVPWRKVAEVMTSAARGVEGVLAEPPPFVLQTALDDVSVTYEINAYTDRPNAMAVTYSRLRERLQDGFAEAGIEIMTPGYQALRDGNPSTIPAPAPASSAGGRPPVRPMPPG